MVKREELPKTWEELADPKWAGKFSTDPTGVAFRIVADNS